MLHRQLWFGIFALLIAAVSARGQTEVMRGAVRRGDDSTAIADVDIRIPALHLATTSNARGEFQFARVPAGRWLLELRRIGFTQLDTLVAISTQPSVSLALVLNVATPSLDTVNVTARLPSTAAIPEFETRRTHATGRFITRDELRAMDDRSFIEVLRARAPGLAFQRAAYGIWAYSPSQQAPQALNAGNKRAGQPCYTQIIVDRVVVYQATDFAGVDPPDLSAYLTRSLDAVEYYSSPSRTPAEFRTTGAACGTLVLWTRRR
jgi:hypothetical protein